VPFAFLRKVSVDDPAPDVPGALRTILERVLALAAQDPGLRAGFRDLGRAFLALAEEPPAGGAPPPAAAETRPPPSAEPIATAVPAAQSTPAEPSIAELAERLFKPGTSPAPVESILRPAEPMVDTELAILRDRCRLKAEASQWAAVRPHRHRNGTGTNFLADGEDGHRELIARAKALPDCFLWMCQRDGPTPADPAAYANLAGGFEAAALAAEILIAAVKMAAPTDLFAQALRLGAEAQSALRSAVAAMGELPDSDQFKFFLWIKETGAESGIWIDRHMRQDDPADAAGWTGRIERLRGLEEKFHWLKDRDRRQRKLFNKIRYHTQRIQDRPGIEDADGWQTIVQSVETLVEDGVPCSNVEIRDALVPVIDALPEAIVLPKHLPLVLREIDRYIQSVPTRPDAVHEEAPTPEVQQVASLLRGRTVVLIGGNHRLPAAQALEKAFGLKGVVWIEGRDQSYLTFEPEVAHPDVGAVLLAIRWSRHGFSDVKALCDEHRKPFVRLPGGYNPNQVAHHVLHQVGERLAVQAAADRGSP